MGMPGNGSTATGASPECPRGRSHRPAASTAPAQASAVPCRIPPGVFRHRPSVFQHRPAVGVANRVLPRDLDFLAVPGCPGSSRCDHSKTKSLRPRAPGVLHACVRKGYSFGNPSKLSRASLMIARSVPSGMSPGWLGTAARARVHRSHQAEWLCSAGGSSPRGAFLNLRTISEYERPATRPSVCRTPTGSRTSNLSGTPAPRAGGADRHE